MTIARTNWLIRRLLAGTTASRAAFVARSCSVRAIKTARARLHLAPLLCSR